jgi:hypothetical protein
MHRLVALAVVASLGCGTLVNDKYTTLVPPPGGFVDGVPGPVRADQSLPHTVTYPNGAQCMIEPSIGVGYIVADLFLVFFVSLVVDAVTGEWHTLDAGTCPGVFVQD